MKTLNILPTVLCLLLPLAAQAQPLHDSARGINAEVRQSLADARTEVRTELANARQELETENLRVDNGIQIVTHGDGKSESANADLPRAEITPQGDFLIDGKAQEIDAGQRQRLLAYRGLVVEIGKVGIDIGQQSAEAVLGEVDGHWIGLIFSALTGRLERRIERTVRENVKPGVRGICRLMPKVRDSQQRLAASLPQFQPYATLQQEDIDDCEDEVRRDFASL